MCRFWVSRVLISDNGRQFDNALFRDFCTHFGIQNHYSSPAHPQANGQAEVANRSLLKIIKTQLERAKGGWPNELPGLLWAYRIYKGNSFQTSLWKRDSYTYRNARGQPQGNNVLR